MSVIPSTLVEDRACWVWYCKTHGVYFDRIHDNAHEECPVGPDKPGEALKYPLQPREVIYYLNEAAKSRKFVSALRRFIDSGGMIAPEITIIET